ncbi:MAG: RNA degradosome polyphosphate kinase [Ginsengibacter sp.]
MFYNRDLSWLSFNFRVLQEAADKEVPLFERIKFLSIFSSNLDEFFRVRYPIIVALSQLEGKTKIKASSEISEDISDNIQQEINRQLEIFGKILTEDILLDLSKNGIVFYYNTPPRNEHLQEIKELFLSKVLSFIQPIFLEGEGIKKFSPVNNYLYLVVTLKGKEEGSLKQCVINIPSTKLARLFTLSSLDGNQYVIFIDDIIRFNLAYIFPGMEIINTFSIKFNRDAELHLDDEFSGDLLFKIEKQLKKRDFGPPSRFLYERGMPKNLQLFLAAIFEVKFQDMFEGGRYHNLSDLSSFPHFNKNLHYQKWKPLPFSQANDSGDIFNIIKSKDILLHVPYQSYNPVLSFFNQAAIDPNVTDIYITLYRVATESHIVNALISAAKNGKNVTVFIELKARFDEENNIKWSKVMKGAGVKINYSLPGIKVHSKIGLVIKKKDSLKETYSILSTGNFNEITAQFYTDHVLMTADSDISKELLRLFLFLEKKEKPEVGTIPFKKLLVTQFNFNKEVSELIDLEIKKAKEGLPSYIRIKVNNLEENNFISELYNASKVGVKIDLIVRSICCLIPGIIGVSENIRIKRLVDRNLEHSRIMIFGTEDANVFIGSSDLMKRNLYHRIEVCVPVEDAMCRQELINYFDLQWNDNQKSVMFDAQMNQIMATTENGEVKNGQQTIYNYLENRA